MGNSFTLANHNYIHNFPKVACVTSAKQTRSDRRAGMGRSCHLWLVSHGPDVSRRPYFAQVCLRAKRGLGVVNKTFPKSDCSIRDVGLGGGCIWFDFFPLWIQMDFNLHPDIVVPKTGNHLINPFLIIPERLKMPQKRLGHTWTAPTTFAVHSRDS